MNKSNAPVTMWVNLDGDGEQPAIRMDSSRSRHTPDKIEDCGEEEDNTQSPPPQPNFGATPKLLRKLSPDFCHKPHQYPDMTQSPTQLSIISELKDSLTVAEESNAGLTREVDVLKEEIEKLLRTKDMFLRLQEDFDNLSGVQTENDHLKEERTYLAQQVQELQEQKTSQQEEMDACSRKHAKEVEDLKRKHLEQEHIAEQLAINQEALEVLRKEHTDLVKEHKVKSLISEKVQKKLAEVESKFKESTDKLEATNETLQEDLFHIKEEAQTLRKEKEKVSEECRNANEQLVEVESRLTNLRKELEFATKECDVLIENKRVLQTEVVDLKAKLTVKTEKLNALKTEQTILASSNAHLQESLTQVSNECREMQRLLKQKKETQSRAVRETPQRQANQAENLALQRANVMQAELVETRQMMWSLEQQNEALKDRCKYIELDRDHIQLLLIQLRDELERQLAKARRKEKVEDHDNGCKCCFL